MTNRSNRLTNRRPGEVGSLGSNSIFLGVCLKILSSNKKKRIGLLNESQLGSNFKWNSDFWRFLACRVSFNNSPIRIRLLFITVECWCLTVWNSSYGQFCYVKNTQTLIDALLCPLFCLFCLDSTIGWIQTNAFK